MTVAEALKAALKLMNDSGKHWTQGDYEAVIDDGERAYCSVGAISQVVVGDAEDAFDVNVHPALFALANVLPEIEPSLSSVSSARTAGWQEFDFVLDKVIRWNDAEERTWDEIVEKFNTAAERAS